jgi:hypothetical protein
LNENHHHQNRSNPGNDVICVSVQHEDVSAVNIHPHFRKKELSQKKLQAVSLGYGSITGIIPGYLSGGSGRPI